MDTKNIRTLADVFDYCIKNGVTKRTFIHKACGMSCDYPIGTDISEIIRKMTEKGPRYIRDRAGRVWKIEQYNYEGSGRDSGYASYGFTVEKIHIE